MVVMREDTAREVRELTANPLVPGITRGIEQHVLRV